MHAHTKDDSWGVDAQIRAQWANEVSQRTPLDSTDLVRGGVDVEWFRDMLGTLGPARFDQVLAAAKYASSAGGHKRAELFAAAVRGDVDVDGLMARVRDKRHQDSVRALGLLPLPDQGTEEALLVRYETLRSFVATDRTSGSQRRASESTAVEIGLENLARAAGYRDPQRLVWAMEAAAVRDLADGPATATDGNLVVSLTLDDAGAPQLTAERAGKPLKSVPANSAKVPEVAALKERATRLRQQSRRMRASLEASSVLGDPFERGELADLLRHPVLAPMLRDLVMVSAEGVAGFASDDPTVLLGPDGTPREAIGGALRVAHPMDLLDTGEWPDFQHAVMAQQRTAAVQAGLPRALHALGRRARRGRHPSRRYAGHQIERRGARDSSPPAAGWRTSRWASRARSTRRSSPRGARARRLRASPAEVEDATLTDVTFHRGRLLAASAPLRGPRADLQRGDARSRPGRLGRPRRRRRP